MPANALSRGDAAVLIIDFQLKLFNAMEEAFRFRHAKNAEHLVFIAQALALPLLVTEQYPKGLGPTYALLHYEGPTIEKTVFSCMEAPGFTETLAATGRKQVVVAGMETHICVAQTVRDLVGAGYEVFVAGDACMSRRKMDWKLGLRRMEGMGVTLMSAEAVLFELLGKAEGPLFKEVSRRVR